MIKADLHLHTCYSHGKNTPAQMYASAMSKNLDIIGFSEHSPRPPAYNYTHEYRDKLGRYLPDYISQVKALRENGHGCKTLLGMEIDWLSGEEDFMRHASSQFDFDYLIGSVHFLDRWGFDDVRDDWLEKSQEECELAYKRYFQIWREMIDSGLFQIAAHPDLIKIFSVRQFHIWLKKPESLAQIRACLLALRQKGMAMEISSAGLRKPCAEIYPCPEIMDMAAELNLSVSMASDAHNSDDIAYNFLELENYARNFGFTEQTVFEHGRKFTLNL